MFREERENVKGALKSKGGEFFLSLRQHFRLEWLIVQIEKEKSIRISQLIWKVEKGKNSVTAC